MFREEQEVDTVLQGLCGERELQRGGDVGPRPFSIFPFLRETHERA